MPCQITMFQVKQMSKTQNLPIISKNVYIYGSTSRNMNSLWIQKLTLYEKRHFCTELKLSKDLLTSKFCFCNHAGQAIILAMP